MSNFQEWLLAAAVIGVLMVIQWWAVGRRYRQRLLTLQARRELDLQTAARLLAQSKQQVTQLRAEIALLRPEVVRTAQKTAQKAARPDTRSAAAKESVSKMLDARPAPSVDAFADTLPSLQFATTSF
jgi:cell division protein FtsB